MAVQNFLAHLSQHRLDCHNLMGDVNTVAVIFNHLDQSVDLPSGGFQHFYHVLLI
jgi:hypothetical protein